MRHLVTLMAVTLALAICAIPTHFAWAHVDAGGASEAPGGNVRSGTIWHEVGCHIVTPTGHGGGGGGWNDVGPGFGLTGRDPQVGLIDPDLGSVLERAVDLAIPCKGSPAVRWRHVRTFDQHSSGPGDTVQGYNWFHTYLQDLTLESGGEATADKDVTWRADAHHSFTFSNSGSYTFAAHDSTFAVLSHEHSGDPSDTYRLEYLDGTLLIFYDFEYTGDTDWRGKLYYIEDVYGNQLEVNYDGDGNIDYISDPSGHYFRYTYLTSGANDGKLSEIKVWKDSTTNDNDKLIAEIDFTYMESGHATYDAGCGETGDLIQVVVSTHKTDETGTTFSITQTTHYRYWEDDTFDDDTHPGHTHELKMILHAEHCQRAEDDPSISDVLTATDANIDDYATYQFEYDSSNRCDQMIVASGGGSCCGGGSDGTGTYTFAYTTQTNTNRSQWAVRCKVERKVSGTVMWTRYLDLNDWGETVCDVLFTTDDSNSDPLWARRYERDTNTGQVTCYYTPASISDYDVSGHSLTYDSDGLVYDYTYDSNAKRLASQRVRKYSEGTGDAEYVGYWEYTALPENTGYRSTRYVLDKAYAYPSETTSSTGGDRVTTDYDYVCYDDTGDLDGDGTTDEQTDRPLVVKVTLPTVTTAQYGPNVAGTRYSYYDTVGRLRWLKDAEGAVHYRSYDDLSGRLTYAVQDVYTGATEGAILPTGITNPDEENSTDIWADWSGAAPQDAGASPAYDFQNAGDSDDYAKRESKKNVDLLGRFRWTENDAGIRTYYAYLDDETRTYPAWDTGTDKPLTPMRRVLTDKDGRTEEVISINPANITFSDPPTGGETVSSQSEWVAWTKTAYDGNLRRSTVKAYHDIPSSGDGSDGTNYYTTTYTYDNDTSNQVTTVEVEDPEDGYTRSTYNANGQRTKVEITATESSGAPTDWKTLTEYYYDQATPGTGSSKGGNGHLTQVKSYHDDSNSNSTSYTYDYRGRRLLTTPPAAPYTLTKYDNMDRVVAVGTYSSAPSSTADPTTTTSNRLALSETAHNNRGQVYQTKRHEIDASDGSDDADLITKTYYDRNGRTVAVVSPGGAAQTTQYNGAGQVIERATCTGLGANVYSSGAVYYSDDEVVEKTTYTFDASDVSNDYYYGQPLIVTRDELEASASSTSGDTITTTTYHHFDDAGRKIGSTVFGTNSSNGTSGGMTSNVQALPLYSPTAGTRSDTRLITTNSFNGAGRLETVTDPDGDVTKYEYDDLGRRTAAIGDYGTGSELNRRTEYEYNGNSDLTKLTARDVDEYGYDGGDSEEDQVTEYVYGHAVNSRWVTEIRYPGSDGQASSASADKVVFTYNNDGTVATRTDQNGSVITRDYDDLRRGIRERVTTVGSGVDSAVLQIVTAYTDAGRVETITQRDSSTADAGSVVNQVKFTYDGLGHLVQDEQEHDGVVDGSTLAVQYSFDTSTSSSNNYSRLDYMTYPNSRTLYAKYTHSDAGSTWLDEKAEAFNQPIQWADTSGSPGGVYVEYTLAGANSRLIKRSSAADTGYYGNDTVLNYDAGTADALDGLDTFGRAVEVKAHEVGDTSTVRTSVEYVANRDSSPQFAEPQAAVVLGRSSKYAYDGLHRLTGSDVGQLNSGRTALTGEWAEPHEISYTMDILGNIKTLDRENSGVSAQETRVYNATNELTSRTVTGEAVRYWVDDDFADNDTDNWACADLDNDGTADGSWSASSGVLSCTGVVSVTGSPSGTGSIILVDGPYYQDAYLTCTATLDADCDNAGIVFGYIDEENFWVKIYKRSAIQKIRVYQVSGGTWNLRSSTGASITSGTPFTMETHTYGYSTDLAVAGQVGLWCSDNTDNEFDDFQVRDIAGPFEVDGRWFASDGGVTVDDSDNNVLKFPSDNPYEMLAIRRGFRGDEFVATYKFKWNATSWPGVVVRWLNPREFLTVWLSPDDGKAYLYRQTADRAEEEYVAASSSGVTLTSGQWYDAKVVVHDDAGSQVLDFYVDANQDADFLDAGEQLFDDEGAIDDNWSAGYVGLANWLETAQEFDDFEVGIDNNSDGDIADAGDDVEIDDDFSSTTMSLTYDNNGNLTDDGIFKHVYDAWNRLVEVTRRVDDETTVAEYEYDGQNRRTTKTVGNCGIENTANDGGNTTVEYYYGGVAAGLRAGRWNVFETRNGSSQTTFQYVWGTQYVDELVMIDKNGDPSESNDCDPDDQSGESTADERYFVHQDRNWNVVALTDYDPSGSDEGNVVERYHYTPYGQFIVLNGDSGNGEMGNVLPTSTVGNPFAHQGLPFDHDKGSYQNRHREHVARMQRFAQRDPLGYTPTGGWNTYANVNPATAVDALGLCCQQSQPQTQPSTQPETQPSPPQPQTQPSTQPQNQLQQCGSAFLADQMAEVDSFESCLGKTSATCDPHCEHCDGELKTACMNICELYYTDLCDYKYWYRVDQAIGKCMNCVTAAGGSDEDMVRLCTPAEPPPVPIQPPGLPGLPPCAKPIYPPFVPDTRPQRWMWEPDFPWMPKPRARIIV